MLIACSAAYRLERLMVMGSGFPEPDKYSARFAIDLRHRPNLLSALIVVFLVNANSIYPYDSSNEAISKTYECRVEVFCNRQATFAYRDRIGLVFAAPGVG